jgi:hypothetical protein
MRTSYSCTEVTLVLDRSRFVTVDGFVASFERDVDRTLEPSRAARMAARLRADALDRALISGADPAASPSLAARAGWLTSRRTRAAVAAGIDRVLSAAREPASPARVMPRRANVLGQIAELRDLARLLRDGGPLYARGIAMLWALLRDGAGPVYAGDPVALAERLGEARTALAG